MDYTDTEVRPLAQAISVGNTAECIQKTQSPTDYFRFKLCVPNIDSFYFSILEQYIAYLKGEKSMYVYLSTHIHVCTFCFKNLAQRNDTLKH